MPGTRQPVCPAQQELPPLYVPGRGEARPPGHRQRGLADPAASCCDYPYPQHRPVLFQGRGEGRKGHAASYP